MKASKILNSDINDLKISSLPTKPTAPSSMGGKGFGAKEMKEAFDKLPMFIIERFNDLIDDIMSIGDDSLAASVKTGLKDGHTLNDMFSDISTGEFGTYFKIFGESIVSHIIGIRSELSDIKKRLDTIDVTGEEIHNA